MKTPRSLIGAALAAALLIMTNAPSASAATGSFWCDGGIDYVDFGPGSAGDGLAIGCLVGGVSKQVVVYTSHATCANANKTLEQVKAWKSTAEAALLSKRIVQINWQTDNNCGGDLGTKFITFMSLRR